MPNRYIRDAILDSERYHGLSSDSVRLLFYELLLSADDFGIVPIGAMYLRRRTAAASGKSVEAIVKMLSELADADLIRTYDADQQRYAWIPRNGFSVRAAKSKYPLPPEQPGFKEVNDLAEKCSANAKHPKSNAKRLHANATDIDIDIDIDIDKKEGADAPSVKAKAWELGLQLLKDSGLTDQSARKFLGSLARDYDESILYEAFVAAAGKADPKGYAVAVLRAKPKRGAAVLEAPRKRADEI